MIEIDAVHGGVLVYLRESISLSERNDLLPDSLETIYVEIKRPYSKSFLVYAWYRPPNTKHQSVC